MENNELLNNLRSKNLSNITPRSRTEAVLLAIHGKIDHGVDTSEATVTPETLFEGETAHDAEGKLVVGTHVCGKDPNVITDFTYFCKDGRRLEDIEHISTGGGTRFHSMFRDCHSLTSIPELDTSNGTDFSEMFSGCTSLKDIAFTGTINVGGIDLSYSKLLTKDSITSLVNALSSTASGESVTVSSTAVNNAFETSEGAGDGSTSDEWTALKAAKSNWTIELKDS